MGELLPIPLYRSAAERARATLARSPWLVVVPTVALALGAFVDWLLEPLLNLGLILAAPIKALVWCAVLFVWRRVLLQGELSRDELETELMARATNLSALALPLLFGTVAFLTLTWGGALASLFVLALVLLPLLEVTVLGARRPLAVFLKEDGAAWAVSQFVAVSVSTAVWVAVVMVAAVVHHFAGAVLSAVLGGPLLTALWLVRGYAWLDLDVVAPAPPKPPPPRKAPKSGGRDGKGGPPRA